MADTAFSNSTQHQAMTASVILSRLFSVLCFRIILDVSYVLYVSPAFYDDPITTFRIEGGIDRYFLSLLFVLAPVVFLSFEKKDLSGIFTLCAMVFLYIPATSIYAFNIEYSFNEIYVIFISIFVSCLFLNIAAIPPFVVMQAKSDRPTVIVGVFFIAIFLGWSLYSGAARNLNFDLSKVYILRDEATDLLDVGIFSYTNLWSQKVFCPMLFAIFLLRRKWFYASLTIVAQFYFFAVTQHRQHLFAPILVFIVYLFYTRNITIGQLYLIVAAAVAAVTIISMVPGFDIAGAIVIRRAIYGGASVAMDWIKHFSGEPKIWWTDRYLLGRPPTIYTGVNITAMMGQIKHPGPPWTFTSGMVGAGYAEAGLFGVILYSAILGAMINYANRLIRNGRSAVIAAAILIGPIRTAWADSDLFTTLLSHGIIVSVITLSMLPIRSGIAACSSSSP